MKSVIVIYVPLIDQTVGGVVKIMNNLQSSIKEDELCKEFHIITIEDPTRKKIKTKVFFKPE